jgi:hypothetical protein
MAGGKHPADDPAHARACGDRWFTHGNRRQGDPSYRDEWYAQQCLFCRFYVPLVGAFIEDWGVCSNATSAFDGRTMFEHDGCEHHVAGEQWQSQWKHAFRDHPDSFARVDWPLFQNGPIVLYHRQEILDADLTWLGGHEYVIDRLDCRRWSDEQHALAALAERLRFPDYFGGNLNALADCLRDLHVPEAGRAVVLGGFDQPAKLMPDVASAILDIFASASRTHLLFCRKLIVLVQSDDPGVSFGPVGATPVTWNPHERLNRSRGL